MTTALTASIARRLADAMPHEHWCHHGEDCCNCSCDGTRLDRAEPLVPVVRDLIVEATEVRP